MSDTYTGLVPTGKIVGEKGKLTLTLDCTNLHRYLEGLGVTFDTYYKRFESPPPGDDTLNSRTHQISPRALCCKGRDESGDVTSKLEIDLLRHYGAPPSRVALRTLAESITAATMLVVTHYQPVVIEIAVRPVKSKSKSDATEQPSDAGNGG